MFLGTINFYFKNVKMKGHTLVKKRVILSLLLVSILLITLGLTACGNTFGGGVVEFYDEDWGNNDSYTGTFQVNARTTGEPFIDPIGIGYYDIFDEEGLNLQYFYYQPARGTVIFRFEGGLINFKVEGSLYIDPSNLEDAFSTVPSGLVNGLLHDWQNEECEISIYVGSGNVKVPGESEPIYIYMMTLFADYQGDEDEMDCMVLVTSDEDLFNDGTLNTSAYTNYNPGSVVSGNVKIQ